MVPDVANATDAVDLIAVLAVVVVCLLARELLLRWRRRPSVWHVLIARGTSGLPLASARHRRRAS